jgi:hypothetical protein
LRGLSQCVQLCTWSPNKLWRSNPYLTYAADEKICNTFGLIKPHQDVSPYFIKRNDTSIRFPRKSFPFGIVSRCQPFSD